MANIKKRSQISIQFNWIFVLIAGALILIFFIGVVYKIRASSKESLACNVLADLESIIIGAGTKSGTSNVVDTPNVAEIEFHCEEDGFSQFNIKGSGCKKDTPIEPIFAPSLIQSGKLITWALEFSVPFKVDNFLFLTHPQIKYIFVGNDVKKYYDELPDEINKIWIANTNSFSELEYENEYNVKLILGSIGNLEVPEVFRKFPKNDISQIKITSNQITFYKRKGNEFEEDGDTIEQASVKILPNDFPSIFAAIFAENKESYECNMRKIYKHLAIISDVYLDKVNSLKQHYETIPQSNCQFYYFADPLENLKQEALQCSVNIDANCISTISTLNSEMITTNQNLKRASCPMIY